MSTVKRKSALDIEKVILQYTPIVSFKVKKSLGSNITEWEDIVNEIMTQVFEKIKTGEFRGESSIGTFIYTITNRRIIDYIRHKSKVLKYAPEANPEPAPEERIELNERSELLAQAIRKLKPKYKEVLYLYYYQELTREEVARKLHISTNKVSERINYAQKLLRKMLRKDFFQFSIASSTKLSRLK
ncbi:MAG: sigma-70 family RNA polymerase sigma factor [Candidatus Aminicenantales bacterium]